METTDQIITVEPGATLDSLLAQVAAAPGPAVADRHWISVGHALGWGPGVTGRMCIGDMSNTERLLAGFDVGVEE